MPITIPTVIASGFGDATGSYYNTSTDQLFIVDAGAGTISAVNPHSHFKTVLGTGYRNPSDLEVSADGLHFYITENPGTLLRVNIASPNRAAATVIATGLNGIDQLALDEAHGVAYVCEFTGGHIQKIVLATGVKSIVATVFAPRGVLLTSDGRFLYVSSDSGAITRYDLATNTSLVVATGLNGPRHLTFADEGESSILVPRANPPQVLQVDLTATPAVVRTLAGPAVANPYSVAVLSSNQILITSAVSVGEADLTASVFSAAGPILLGIGFVPADAAHLPGGFADTTGDPSYFFQVKDCPFGGTLPLMINWQRARTLGASFYQVFVNNTLLTAPYSDYLWSVALNRFELQTTVPVNGFFPLRSAGQIWLNFWLGMLLDTTGLPNNALATIGIKLFSAASTTAEVGHVTDAGRSATLMIDNTSPTAILESILQQPGNVAVGTCAIVTTGTPTFTFAITASAPAHLLSWSLGVYWGDNKSAAIASDTYANHISASRIWTGLSHVAVPPPGPAPWNATVAGDPTSTHCAHTFYLNAWDRVINGWGYIHGPAGYTKSVTLML